MKLAPTTKQKGFTLVEALVAITILIIGVIGPLALAARGISDGLYAANQITANYLAQEAIEAVTWQRNYNFVNAATADDWKNGLSSNTDFCPDVICPLPSSFSNFTRQVNLALSPNNDELRVTVTISWYNGITPKSMTVVGHLYPRI